LAAGVRAASLAGVAACALLVDSGCVAGVACVEETGATGAVCAATPLAANSSAKARRDGMNAVGRVIGAV
jgi:hypothetical protein